MQEEVGTSCARNNARRIWDILCQKARKYQGLTESDQKDKETNMQGFPLSTFISKVSNQTNPECRIFDKTNNLVSSIKLWYLKKKKKWATDID